MIYTDIERSWFMSFNNKKKAKFQQNDIERSWFMSFNNKKKAKFQQNFNKLATTNIKKIIKM